MLWFVFYSNMCCILLKNQKRGEIQASLSLFLETASGFYLQVLYVMLCCELHMLECVLTLCWVIDVNFDREIAEEMCICHCYSVHVHFIWFLVSKQVNIRLASCLLTRVSFGSWICHCSRYLSLLNVTLLWLSCDFVAAAAGTLQYFQTWSAISQTSFMLWNNERLLEAHT